MLKRLYIVWKILTKRNFLFVTVHFPKKYDHNKQPYQFEYITCIDDQFKSELLNMQLFCINRLTEEQVKQLFTQTRQLDHEIVHLKPPITNG